MDNQKGEDRLEKAVYTYYNYLIRSLRSSLPAERRSIREMLESKNYSVRLQDGSLHTIDPDELKLAVSIIPRYMVDRVRLPLVIGKVSGSVYFRLINCSKEEYEFVLRLAGRSRVEYTEPCTIYIDEFEEIIKKFRTLVIQTIEIS